MKSLAFPESSRCFRTKLMRKMRNLLPLEDLVDHRDLREIHHLLDLRVDAAPERVRMRGLLLFLLLLLRLPTSMTRIFRPCDATGAADALDASRATTRKPDTVPLLRQFA